MSNASNPEVHLDHLHAHAVCQAIGERLRDSLDKSWTQAPKALHELYARLPELDREHSPSIVPSA